MCVSPPQKSLGCCILCPSSHFSKRNMSIRVWLWQYVSTDTEILKSTNMCLLPHCIPAAPDFQIDFCSDGAQLIPAALECFISFLIKNDGVCGFFIRNFSNVRRQTIKTKRKRPRIEMLYISIFPASPSKESLQPSKGRNTRSDIIYWRRVLDISYSVSNKEPTRR